MKRRDFLYLSAAAAAMPFSTIASGLASVTPKKILVLGGTNFVGPAVVTQAIQRGHEVTLFNRGITRPYLFPELEKLKGNRSASDSDLSTLQGSRKWDVVIDTWPQNSKLVQDTVDLLKDRTDYYFFCSSIAVYKNFAQVGLNEESEVHQDSGWYGSEKVLSEKALTKAFEGRYGISRSHAITGPMDNGNAFHFWIRKLALQERVLAPGSGLDPVQITDVRDLANWIIDCSENKRTGIHNVVGSANPLTFKSFLERSRAGLNSKVELTWVDADFLRKEQKIRSFTDMPLWAPLDEDEGFYQIDGSKAINAGFRMRPFEDTARDSWRWFQSYFFNNTNFPRAGWGISVERESEILKEWQSHLSG